MKLCSMMKMRKKSGLRRAQRMYQGRAVSAEGREGGGMEQAKSVAPALCEERPEENSAAAEDDAGGAFGEDGEAKEKSEEHQGEPGSLREDGSIFVAR